MPLELAGTGNPSEIPEFIPVFIGVRVARTLVFCVVFCRSLFVLLSFFCWPLCCLSFFDLRILITPLESLNSSLNYIDALEIMKEITIALGDVTLSTSSRSKILFSVANLQNKIASSFFKNLISKKYICTFAFRISKNKSLLSEYWWKFTHFLR